MQFTKLLVIEVHRRAHHGPKNEFPKSPRGFDTRPKNQAVNLRTVPASAVPGVCFYGSDIDRIQE